jgi:hypothetical protein
MDRWLQEWVDGDCKRDKYKYEENWWRRFCDWWKPINLPMYDKRK